MGNFDHPDNAVLTKDDYEQYQVTRGQYPVDLLEDRGNGVLQVAQAREYVTDSQGNQAFKQLAGGSGRKSSFATVCNGGGGQRRICSALHTFAHLNWRSSSPLGSMS